MRRGVRGALAVAAGGLVILLAHGGQADPCKPGAFDVRSRRLVVRDVTTEPERVGGFVRNTAPDAAHGVVVWVNYIRPLKRNSRSDDERILAQQCVVIGELAPGEEKGFQVAPPVAAQAIVQFAEFVPSAQSWGWSD